MAFRLLEVGPSRQVAQDRQTGGRLDLGLAELQVARAAHPVEYDTGDAQAGVELLVAQDLGGHAAGDLGGVGDQNDRRAQELGQLGCGAFFIQAGVAVEHPHHTFHHRDLAAARSLLE